MKKVIFLALLALAGATTANAGKWVNFNCPDGSHHSEYWEGGQNSGNDQPDEDEEECFEDYCARRMLELCGPNPNA